MSVCGVVSTVSSFERWADPPDTSEEDRITVLNHMEMTIQVASPDEAMALFGLGDRNLKLLRDALQVDLTARGRVLRLTGDRDPVEQAASMLNGMISLYRSGEKMDPDHLERQLGKLPDGVGPHGVVPDGVVPDGVGPEDDRADATAEGADAHSAAGGVQQRRRAASPQREGRGGAASPETRGAADKGARVLAYPDLIQACARSRGQEKYMRAIAENDVVFCIGPAGTGKTFLAVRMAVHLLHEGEIRRLILCRPAVEAGEKLGFLPGDFQAKINPYLRPLHDALNDILDYDQVKRYILSKSVQRRLWKDVAARWCSVFCGS